MRDPLEYYCVIDFECTCIDGLQAWRWRHEVIEFPCILVSAASREVVARFHHYVKPVEAPELDNYCKELTGITQEQVDDALPLHEVLASFQDWLVSLHLLDPETGARSFTVCTDGPWDMESFLFKVGRLMLHQPRHPDSSSSLRSASGRTFHSLHTLESG